VAQIRNAAPCHQKFVVAFGSILTTWLNFKARKGDHSAMSLKMLFCSVLTATSILKAPLEDIKRLDWFVRTRDIPNSRCSLADSEAGDNLLVASVKLFFWHGRNEIRGSNTLYICSYTSYCRGSWSFSKLWFIRSLPSRFVSFLPPKRLFNGVPSTNGDTNDRTRKA